MTNKCVGCGIDLQTTEPSLMGYANSLESAYCKRCYRIKHYGDYTSLKKHAVSSDKVFEAVNQLEGTILLVIDVTDIDSGLFTGIQRHLAQRDFIIVLTKWDLLPKTVSKQKIESYLLSKLRDMPINVLGIAMSSDKGKLGISNLIQQIKRLRLKQLIAVGYANMGKSTLINALIGKQDHLTISPYPHTTLEINKIEWDYGTIIDTPGIKIENSFFDTLEFEDFENYSILSPFKPKTYQLDSAQSFIIDKIGVISIIPKNQASVTLYFSTQIPIHRTKYLNLESYLEKHAEVLPKNVKTKRITEKLDKFDIVFKQLGWYCLQGEFEMIEIKTSLIDQVITRKALI
jgi:30S ribosome assembly GTPase